MTIRRQVKPDEKTSIHATDTTVSGPEDSSRSNSDVDAQPRKKSPSGKRPIKKTPSKEKRSKSSKLEQPSRDTIEVEVEDILGFAALITILVAILAYVVHGKYCDISSTKWQSLCTGTAPKGPITMTIDRPGTWTWLEGRLTTHAYLTATKTVCPGHCDRITSPP
ncbi:hypothetical protein KCU81_g1466, partial [Aureobasidium melanogenum]|uniref:Uncharacterized protein n=1 Tax=Aureobasidium melanogenum (strain CBS 110374) TaxID=1043003 RepID=A0A074W8Q3_AURM1